MLVLGLQGSPRKKGNTRFLMKTFLAEAEKLGAAIELVDVAKRNILPCREYTVCEKKGFCPIDDDMPDQIYPLLRRAEVVVAATPVFFYNMSAQLKALVDRCQTLWARKYRLGLRDPASRYRRGFLLAVGATRGKNLFDAIRLSTRYFFDAISASYEGELTYRGFDGAGTLAQDPDVLPDVTRAAGEFLGPLLNRPKILFVGRDNSCASQMAGAFAQLLAGDRLDVNTAGIEPAGTIDAVSTAVMAEKKIDMAFRQPRGLEQALAEGRPDTAVLVGLKDCPPALRNRRVIHWPLERAESAEKLRLLRDALEERVRSLVRERG